jgi:integrase
MPLTDTAVRNAKPADKAQKLFDGGGLFLLITPTGQRYWRLKYRFGSKEKLLALGVYPDVSLALARKKRNEARERLAAGIDPSEVKKADQRSARIAAINSFEAVALAWMEERRPYVEPAQYDKTLARFKNDAFPWIGKRPISGMEAPEILDVLKRVDSRGARFTAHRLRGEISRVFRYGIKEGLCRADPARDLLGAIPPSQTTHFAAITEPAKVGEMLRAFDGFSGTFPVLCALKLAPMLFVRPGELRQAEWAHFDLDKGDWRYLVSKTDTPHLVPLARQAVTILRELYALTGTGRYVFPGARDRKRPMSEAAINAALRRLGYDTRTEITGHGFRAMARTILHEELEQKPEVIEHQLAHAVPDNLGAAYNRTKFIRERRVMMQRWADYLDQLKAGATVVPLSPSVTSAPKAARYFVDTEFTSLDNAELISVGIVSQDGREFYAERSHFAREACSDFVHTHVLPQLGKMPTRVLTDAQLRNELRKWIAAIPLDPLPVLCCDAGGATYDLPLLYFALGGPLPRGWSTEDVSPLIDPVLLNSYHATHGGDHHALHDARANAYAFREPDAQVIPITAAVK